MAYTTIDDPSVYFQTGLYTGNGNDNKSINLGSANFTGEYVGQDIQPDWVWIKQRSGATRNHSLTDSTRGVTKHLSSDLDEAEATASNRFKSFDSNGFTLGDSGYTNDADDSFVAWVWKCNGGTATATVSESGNNPANVRQTNTDAGFSIITYTGTGAVGTIAHGLGVVPEFIIVKNRGRVKDWCVYHASIEETHKLELNLTSAKSDDNAVWNDTAPTSSVFTVGPSDERTNANDDTYVAYCFAPIQGYSKFGSYVGNGAEPDGTFVYTGFKPAWIMIHASSESGQAWVIGDNKRDPHNMAIRKMFANNSAVESAAVGDNNWDFLSNGFKIRTQDDAMNKSGVTFVYMAFAEHPFVSSEGVPTTAR